MRRIKDDFKGVAGFPNRVLTLRTIDCGPMDADSSEPTGHCPHCGAAGRWIHVFLCDDGLIRGAMSGCIKLFPEVSGFSELSVMSKTALEKEKDAIRKGRTFPNGEAKIASWFRNVLDALRDFENEVIEFDEAEAIAKKEYYIRDAWLVDNGYKR